MCGSRIYKHFFFALGSLGCTSSHYTVDEARLAFTSQNQIITRIYHQSSQRLCNVLNFNRWHSSV